MCLQNWLTEKHHALFYVLNEDKAKSEILKDVIAHAVDIDNISVLEKLYQQPLSKVNILESYSEEPELIKQLRPYLEPQEKPEPTKQAKPSLKPIDTSSPISASTFFNEDKANNGKKRNLDETIDFSITHREQFKAALTAMTDQEYGEFQKRLKATNPGLDSPSPSNGIKSH